MSLSTTILQFFKSTMPLEEIAIKDTESEAENVTVSDDNAKPSKVVGNIAPYVKINGYVFDHKDIEDMVFDESGFLPTINITIRDTQGIFKSAYFPKSNPILSLYLRAKHDKLKCVRCDFLITSITTDSSIDKMEHGIGRNLTMVMSGSLFVPMLYDNTPKSYAGVTSHEVLQELAADMRLGFATNENYTNDRMTWVKPYIRKSSFMNDVLTRTFKDDKSFFMGFISKHYNLTLINMGSMFGEDFDFDKVYASVIDYDNLQRKQSDEPSAPKQNDNPPLILTNFSRMARSETYLMEHRPETRQGSLLAKNGYIRNIGYYDQMFSKDYKGNFVNLDVKPLNATLVPGKTDTPDEMLDGFAANSNGEWCGIDYNNGHANFNFAQIQNEHNNDAIRKITLYVKLNGVNLNLMRGMRVPVLIVRQNTGEKIEMESQLQDKDLPKKDVEKNDEVNMITDKWLSGFYVIGALRHVYESTEKNAFYTEATLLRMNWDEPAATMPQKK